MAQHKSSMKRIRSTETRHKRNTAQESAMKTAIKKVRNETDKAKAVVALKDVSSTLDKLALKRVIHPNKASNQKSKLAKVVNALS